MQESGRMSMLCLMWEKKLERGAPPSLIEPVFPHPNKYLLTVERGDPLVFEVPSRPGGFPEGRDQLMYAVPTLKTGQKLQTTELHVLAGEGSRIYCQPAREASHTCWGRF